MTDWMYKLLQRALGLNDGSTNDGSREGTIWPCSPSSQSYAVANTATFLFETTPKHDTDIKKSTKYLSGNSAHDCQNDFTEGFAVWPLDQELCPWTQLGALPPDLRYWLAPPCSPWPPFPTSGSARHLLLARRCTFRGIDQWCIKSWLREFVKRESKRMCSEMSAAKQEGGVKSMRFNSNGRCYQTVAAETENVQLLGEVRKVTSEPWSMGLPSSRPFAYTRAKHRGTLPDHSYSASASRGELFYASAFSSHYFYIQRWFTRADGHPFKY